MPIGKISTESPTDTLGRLCYDDGYKGITVYDAAKSAGIIHTHGADGKTWWSLPDEELEAYPADDVMGLIPYRACSH